MSDTAHPFETTSLKQDANYLAPDGSQIRLLPNMKGGGLCHCTLPAGKTSAPVSHSNVEEIWYVIDGDGEVWRKCGEVEQVVKVCAGTSLTIPPHTSFQFRNIGSRSLCILISTMPPWPGPNEAQKCAGVWPASVAETGS